MSKLNMNIGENLEFKLSPPPSYLKELYVEDPYIILVYLKRVSKKEEIISPTVVESFEKPKDDSLDLTGNPLKVDLNGDESQISSGTTQNIHLWTEEEETQLPVDLTKARQFINQQFRLKKRENSSKPIYVICDGNNTETTVILGAQMSENFIMTTKVNILGYIPKDHKSLSLENMVENHILNTRAKDCKINYITKFRYYLYGTFLQQIMNLYDLEIYGSICIEAIYKDKCFFDSPQNVVNTKTMILQLIVGHPLSSVHFLWKDLCLLQTFLDILSSPDNCNNPETVLSPEHIEVSDVYKQLSEALGVKFLKKEAKMNFSLDNIRVGNTLDELWNILKRCENLADLRESFHFLFEELTETHMNLKLSDKDTSSIATIVSGILNGKLAVPTITFSQALEFLFELGAEKLKNDYQIIIKNHYSSSESAILATWSQLRNTLTLQDGFRKTRITVNQKPGKMDLNHNVSKLSYLGKLHIAVEMIYLVKTETSLPEETFDYFCERVYKNYVETDINKTDDFLDLQNSKICDYEVVIEVSDKKIIKNDIPATWSMKMTSLINDTEVITLYHLSQLPIFPSTIYDNFDTSAVSSKDDLHFYVSKLERYKNFLC